MSSANAPLRLLSTAASLPQNPGYLEKAHRNMDMAKVVIRHHQHHFGRFNLSELIQAVQHLKSRLILADTQLVLARAEGADVAELEFLERDRCSLTSRVESAVRKHMHTDIPSVHIGTITQDDAGSDEINTLSACEGIALAALDHMFKETAQSVDKAFDSEKIDAVVREGVRVYQKIAESDGKADFGPNMEKKEVISFRIEKDAAGSFGEILQTLREHGRRHGFPIGATLENLQQHYTIAFLSPDKIVFFDSHGAPGFPLPIEKAYMLTFSSERSAAAFLASRLPFEEPDSDDDGAASASGDPNALNLSLFTPSNDSAKPIPPAPHTNDSALADEKGLECRSKPAVTFALPEFPDPVTLQDSNSRGSLHNSHTTLTDRQIRQLLEPARHTSARSFPLSYDELMAAYKAQQESHRARFTSHTRV